MRAAPEPQGVSRLGKDMGVIICAEHGRCGIIHACKHLCRAVKERRLSPTFHVYELKVDGIPETPIWASLCFCEECIAARSLPLPSRPLTEAEQDAELVGGPLDTDTICELCFARAQKVASSKRRRLEFTADLVRVVDGALYVGGRCCADLIRIGDAFTSVRMRTSTATIAVSQEIFLLIDAIVTYRKLVNQIYPGLTAELLLQGEGVQHVAPGVVLESISELVPFDEVEILGESLPRVVRS